MDTATGNISAQYETKLHALYTVFDGLTRAITLDAAGGNYALSWVRPCRRSVARSGVA